jgi:hypothetical protein
MLEKLEYGIDSCSIKTSKKEQFIMFNDLHKIKIKKKNNYFVLLIILIEFICFLFFLLLDFSYLHKIIFLLFISVQFYIYAEYVHNNYFDVDIFLNSGSKISLVADDRYIYDIYFIKSNILNKNEE